MAFNLWRPKYAHLMSDEQKIIFGYSKLVAYTLHLQTIKQNIERRIKKEYNTYVLDRKKALLKSKLEEELTDYLIKSLK